MLIAVVLFVILQPINFIYVVFFKLRSNSSLIKRISGYFRVTAIAIDRFGNVNFKALLNATLIREVEQGFSFGDYHETISSCLGKNQLYGNLTYVGKVLTWILDALDKNHCVKSVRATPANIAQGITPEFWKLYCIEVLGEDLTQVDSFYDEYFNLL